MVDRFKERVKSVVGDIIGDENKGNTSLIEVPFELPPEVPNLYQVEYDKADSSSDVRPKLTIHVEVNRSGFREGARRFSNVDIWTEGYNDPPTVFNDVINELKVHDDKVKENLRQKCSPKLVDSKSNDLGSLRVKNSSSRSLIQSDFGDQVPGECLVGGEGTVDFSGKEGNNYGVMEHLSQSTPNTTRNLDFTSASEVSQPPSILKSMSIKSKKSKHNSRKMTCYSVGDGNSHGFDVKYSPTKGSSIVTQDKKKEVNLSDQNESATILIKILPGKPAKVKVLR